MKRFISIIIIISILFSFSACSNSHRLTNMAIVQAVGIDEENGVIKVSLQYLVINKGTGTNEGINGNITGVTAGKGYTIADAVKNVEKVIAESLFFGQNKLIIIGKNVDIASRELLSFLSDGNTVRPDVYIIRSKGNAEEIINNKQQGKRVPAENICKQLKRDNLCFTVNDFLNTEKKNDLPLIEAVNDYTVFRK